VAALAGTDKEAAGILEELPEFPVEGSRHLRRSGDRGSFAEDDQLKMNGRWVDARVIVREQIQGLRGRLAQEFIQRRRLDRDRHLVGSARPDPRVGVPLGMTMKMTGFIRALYPVRDVRVTQGTRVARSGRMFGRMETVMLVRSGTAPTRALRGFGLSLGITQTVGHDRIGLA